ncbi:hypothetical protein BO70DRAFT_396362 [Aspergillus heteromorphus CBS 117.55]|uniref:Uncharacterized protein n=1 Tax=Aspergillus heteromorphus CBS 117.55 TaxID=1448321 RepID=A0A317W9U5_9EURO|nr:uncharacterized protein BO70DRAFT_396362 [Aspergillus heteromorphus CBS 117.55]PWY82072.1 hypothetical protein BO70DRAFT_396362 [Aspergillus heteromorphus CBS 117.55]
MSSDSTGLSPMEAMSLSEHSINQKRGNPLDSFLEGPVLVSDLNCLFVTLWQ